MRSSLENDLRYFARQVNLIDKQYNHKNIICKHNLYIFFVPCGKNEVKGGTYDLVVIAAAVGMVTLFIATTTTTTTTPTNAHWHHKNQEQQPRQQEHNNFAHIPLLTNILEANVTTIISKMRFFNNYLKLTITSKQKQLERSNCARMKAHENIFPTVTYLLHFAAFLTELWCFKVK